MVMKIANKTNTSCAGIPSVMVKSAAISTAVNSNIGKVVRACALVRASGGDTTMTISLKGTDTTATSSSITVKRDSYKLFCGNTAVLQNSSGNLVVANTGKLPLHVSSVKLEIVGNPTTPTPSPTTSSNLYSNACSNKIAKTTTGTVQH